MKFDKFLAKLFSRRVLLSIISIILLVLFLSSCMLTAEDCLMCMFCGCFTPETTCAIIDCINKKIDKTWIKENIFIVNKNITIFSILSFDN